MLLRLRPADPPPYAAAEKIERPIAFAAGRVRTVNGLAFTPDGRTLYTSYWVGERDSTGRRRLRIFEWVHDGHDWRGPTPVRFGSRYTDNQPVMTPDGRRLYFQSTRPEAGDSAEVPENLWYVDRDGTGWSEARPLPALNTAASREGYAMPTAVGTVYFYSDRPGGAGEEDFYRSRLVNGALSAPELVTELNSEHGENDLFVDPEERFAIFNRYVSATRDSDLYIAFRDGDRWGAPRPLSELNGPTWELTPMVSPNGQYLFYTLGGTIMQTELAPLIEPRRTKTANTSRE